MDRKFPRILISADSYSSVRNALEALKAGDLGSAQSALEKAINDWEENAVPTEGKGDWLHVLPEYLKQESEKYPEVCPVCKGSGKIQACSKCLLGVAHTEKECDPRKLVKCASCNGTGSF